MFNIFYNGEDSRNRYCEIVERPRIPSPHKRMEEVTVPGRNGALHITDGTYEEIAINISMNFKSGGDEDFYRVLRVIKLWLYGEGDGKLRFSDMDGKFYKVNHIDMSEIERDNNSVGRFTATFYCEPYIYLDEGEEEIELNTSSIYQNNYECEPIYYLSVGRNGAVIQIVGQNGVRFPHMTENTVIIDTALGLAYDEDGNMVEVEGDIASLKMPKGTVRFSVLSYVGGRFIPRWREL